MEQVMTLAPLNRLPERLPYHSDFGANVVAAREEEPPLCKKTLSTLSLFAFDLIGLECKAVSEMITSLFDLAAALGRDEIVIEHLEVIAADREEASVARALTEVERGIVHASRQMKIDPPRVALEKRGSSFDVRIYVKE